MLINIKYLLLRNCDAWLSSEHTRRTAPPATAASLRHYHRVVFINELKNTATRNYSLPEKQCFVFNTLHASALLGHHRALFSVLKTRHYFTISCGFVWRCLLFTYTGKGQSNTEYQNCFVTSFSWIYLWTLPVASIVTHEITDKWIRIRKHEKQAWLRVTTKTIRHNSWRPSRVSNLAPPNANQNSLLLYRIHSSLQFSREWILTYAWFI